MKRRGIHCSRELASKLRYSFSEVVSQRATGKHRSDTSGGVVNLPRAPPPKKTAHLAALGTAQCRPLCGRRFGFNAAAGEIRPGRRRRTRGFGEVKQVGTPLTGLAAELLTDTPQLDPLGAQLPGIRTLRIRPLASVRDAG